VPRKPESKSLQKAPDPVLAEARRVAQDLLKAKVDGDKTREQALWEGILDASKPVVDDGVIIGHEPDHKLRLEALKVLLSYGYGKPAQMVEHVGQGGGSFKIEFEAARPKWVTDAHKQLPEAPALDAEVVE